jgi:8-oxo-dGTP diphosphatase
MKEIARAFVTNETGQVLLGKRARGIGKGQFALLGGKPDEGETLEQAITREIKEEVGLDFDKPNLVFDRVDNETDPNDPWRTYFFTGVASGVIRLNKEEISEIIFISEEDLD